MAELLQQTKAESLGVDAALIAAHGAVSEPVARTMAEGAIARSRANVSVAVTGMAGPPAARRKAGGRTVVVRLVGRRRDAHRQLYFVTAAPFGWRQWRMRCRRWPPCCSHRVDAGPPNYHRAAPEPHARRQRPDGIAASTTPSRRSTATPWPPATPRTPRSATRRFRCAAGARSAACGRCCAATDKGADVWKLTYRDVQADATRGAHWDAHYRFSATGPARRQPHRRRLHPSRPTASFAARHSASPSGPGRARRWARPACCWAGRRCCAGRCAPRRPPTWRAGW